MKRRMILIIVVALAVFSGVNMNTPTLAEDGFYVVAGGGGPKGKVLKTQTFTYGYDATAATDSSIWEKLANPSAWNYTKISATSKLVIAYQDALSLTSTGNAHSAYQIRVNDAYSDAGTNGNLIVCSVASVAISNYGLTFSTTGIWSNLPQGVVNLSIWHKEYNCNTRARGVWPGSVVVMEIEP